MFPPQAWGREGPLRGKPHRRAGTDSGREDWSPRAERLSERRPARTEWARNESRRLKQAGGTSSVPCRFFLEGRCERNPCRFFHGGCWGEGKAPSPRGGGPRGAAHAHAGDDEDAAEDPAATDPPESLRRLEEAVDRPALEEARKEEEIEVEPPEVADARSLDNGEAEDM